MAKLTPSKPHKELYQVIYSIVLILVIPAAIIVNTILFTSAIRARIDQVLYDKTIAIGETINASILDVLNNTEYLQPRIELITAFNNDIDSLTILVRSEDAFRVKASLSPELVDKRIDNIENELAWHKSQPVAFLTKGANSERFWSVIMPLVDAAGRQRALLSMRVSLKVMDQLTRQILTRSYIILALTILVIVLLLANQTRFFEYAVLYRKLKEVDKMKDEFISMASHELRTPVTAIRGYVSMILEGTFGKINKDIKESLEIAHMEAARLDSLVEDLLNVSRIEQGRMKIESKPLEISKVIADTVRELKVKADEKKLVLAFKPHAKPLPLINVDEARLKQVLVNLIGNSIKYTMKGSVHILTKLKTDDKALEIRIKDTGIGMNAKERERLFQKFYRVRNEQTAEVTGTGLGLWITKQIVELMDGRVIVDSIKDVGTQVTLLFTIVEEKEKKA